MMTSSPSTIAPLGVLLSLACAFAQDPAEATGSRSEFLPAFDADARNWQLLHAEFGSGTGPDGHDALRLHGPGPVHSRPAAVAFTRIPGLPVGEQLDFQVQVHAHGVAGVSSLRIVARDRHGTILGRKVHRFRSRADRWQPEYVGFTLPERTHAATISFVQPSPGEVLFSRPSLRATGNRTAEVDVTPTGLPASHVLDGPGVILAQASACVRGTAEGNLGVVTFPIPNANAHQVPISFDVTVDPPRGLPSVRWRVRSDRENLLCEITVSVPTDTEVTVGWRANVLVGVRDDPPLPRAGKPSSPTHARPWLASTKCVQSDDRAIVAKARELAQGIDDIESYARAVIAFTSTHRGDGATPLDTLDARRALACGGSCTSRANLCAALLRAHGIPARTQAHLPTWAGPLYEHWLVEYWHPDAGWTWIESTRGEFRPRPWSLVVLSVANPADEDESFSARLQRSGVMLGAPLFAVHDVAPPLANSRAQVRNHAYAVLHLRGLTTEDLRTMFEGARHRFARMRDAALRGELMPSAPVVKAIVAQDLKALRDALQ